VRKINESGEAPRLFFRYSYSERSSSSSSAPSGFSPFPPTSLLSHLSMMDLLQLATQSPNFIHVPVRHNEDKVWFTFMFVIVGLFSSIMKLFLVCCHLQMEFLILTMGATKPF
jgi:hypothetical protein